MAADTQKTECKDCGLSYQAGAPHYMFCKARTCDNCQTTVDHKLEFYIDQDGDETSVRLCDDCAEKVDEGELDIDDVVEGLEPDSEDGEEDDDSEEDE